MGIEEEVEAALFPLRRDMASEGGSVRLVRLDGQIAFLELSGPRSMSWTFPVTAAVQSCSPHLNVMVSLSDLAHEKENDGLKVQLEAAAKK